MIEKVIERSYLKGPFYSNKAYKFHIYADYFPLMDSQEIGELGKSIRKDGQREAIVLLSDLILDGRNRYLACHNEGIAPRFVYYDDELDPLDFVIIKNFYRRHLTTIQKSKIIIKLLKIEKRKARERRARTQLNGKTKNNKPKWKYSVSTPGSLPEETDKKIKKGRAIDLVGKKLKVAPKTVKKIEYIDKITKFDPFIKKYWEKAQEKNISLEEAYRNIRKALDIHSTKKKSAIPHIKEQFVEVKNQEIPLNKRHENTLKIKQVNQSIKEGIVTKFEEAGKIYEQKKKNSNGKNQDEFKDIGASIKKEKSFGFQHPISIKKMYVCKRCPKATVMAVECKCEECGHINFASTVLCDDDIINGFHKLRNPNSVLCEKSPDYDLVVKKIF